MRKYPQKNFVFNVHLASTIISYRQKALRHSTKFSSAGLAPHTDFDKLCGTCAFPAPGDNSCSKRKVSIAAKDGRPNLRSPGEGKEQYLLNQNAKVKNQNDKF